MRADNEPPWVSPVVQLVCMVIVGALWYFDHPTAATDVALFFGYVGLSNRFDEWQGRRRDDERAYNEMAERRHQQIMRALHVIYGQVGGRAIGPFAEDDED